MEPDNDSAEGVEEQESAVTLVEAGTGYEDEEGEEQTLKASVEFNPGADLTEACDLYTEDAVFQRYLRGVTKDLGNAIRAGLKKFLAFEGDDAVPVDEIPALVVAELANWRPDVTRRAVRKDPTDAILENFQGLTPEKQKDLIEQLMATAEAG